MVKMQIENGLFDLHYLCRVRVPPESPNYFDLEDEADQSRLENVAFALGSLSGLVVIDKVQRRPDLIPTLRVLLYKPTNKTPFLLLGNSSPDSILGPGA